MGTTRPISTIFSGGSRGRAIPQVITPIIHTMMSRTTWISPTSTAGGRARSMTGSTDSLSQTDFFPADPTRTRPGPTTGWTRLSETLIPSVTATRINTTHSEELLRQRNQMETLLRSSTTTPRPGYDTRMRPRKTFDATITTDSTV